jgi:tetratricopeptide (TPR) repeat protein
MNRKIIITSIIAIIALVLVSTLLVARSVNSVESQLEAANKYITDGDYEKAILAFEKVLKIDENNIEARMGLAEVYVITDEIEKAIKYLEEVIEIDDEYVDAYIELGRILIEEGRLEEANKLLEKGLEKTGNEQIKALLESINGVDAETDTGENSLEEDSIDVEASEIGEIPLDDPEKIISFIDHNFEKCVRDFYGLGSKAIRWKDIGFKSELALSDEYGPIESFEDLQWFINLSHIYPGPGEDNYGVKGNLNSLSGLSKLKHIEFDYTKVEGNLSSLSGLNQLEYILIDSTQVEGNISNLSGLNQLKYIFLFGDNQIAGDVSSLSGLKQLEHIRIHSTKIKANLNSLSPLRQLKSIGLNGSQVEGDLNSLSDMKQLKLIYLSNTQVKGNLS